MIALDASVVIAHFSAHDSHHARAKALLKAHVADALLLHSVTLTEVLVGPVRGGREVFAEQQLEAMGIREWTPRPASASRLARLRVETGLRLPDCCVLDAALQTGSAIATFDHSLARAAEGVGVAVVSR